MQRHERFAWTWGAAAVISLSLCAWGFPGNEQASLLVGRGPTVDGFEQKVAEVPLTPAPKQDTIGVSRVRDRKRVGGDVRWH